MLCMLGKIFSRQYFEIFSNFSPQETICMKYQTLFSGKYQKNSINFLTAELAQRVVMVKVFVYIRYFKQPKISNTLFHNFLA